MANVGIYEQIQYEVMVNRATLLKKLEGKISSPDMKFPEKPAETRAAAVLIPFVDHEDEVTVILTQRSENLKDHPGQISFPGGSVDETDASPAHTATRETFEELGIGSDKIEIIGGLDPFETGTGFYISPMLGFITPPLEYVLQTDEVEEVFEVPLTHFLDENNHKTHSIVYKGQELDFWAMPYENRFIWGATAHMLYCLYEMLTK